MAATLKFPHDLRQKLAGYVPSHAENTSSGIADRTESTNHFRPFVTLTYAQSLDGQISLSPGQPTALSGPASKAMTHYLRSVHDGILIGSGTAIADDPGLNCRLEDAVRSPEAAARNTGKTTDSDSLNGQPRPIVLDRRGRWDVSTSSKVIKLARERVGRAPWIFVAKELNSQIPQESRTAIESVGGEYCSANDDFPTMLKFFAKKGLRSVMIEGGASLINDLLAHHQDCIDSLIITIAPVFLGEGGVAVNPKRYPSSSDDSNPAVRTRDVSYLVLDRDIVLCAKIERTHS